MSETGYYLLVCVAMFASTSVARGSFIVLPPRIQLPRAVERALRFAPTCALTAIIVPTVMTKGGHVIADVGNPRLWGVLAGAAVFSARRSMVLMIGVGMGVFTLLRLLGT